jgi:hypothetical protein
MLASDPFRQEAAIVRCNVRARFVLGLLAVTLAAPAVAEELPVRSVVLSNAGLAQIERGGTLAPGAAITLRVPTEDVDDILKSLLLRDAAPDARVEGVRLPAQDLAAEAFRGLPLKPEDFESRAALLSALRGQAVEAAGVAGRLAEAADAEGGGVRLSLITPQGLRLLVVREGDEVRLVDTALAGRIARAAEALAAARAEGSRALEIRLAGATAPREVGFTTVTAAPLWKPSWRLIVPPAGAAGEARLQGWAVVENRSGADWDGVRLSLVSGNPAAFAQPLYAPILVRRPVLPVRAAEQLRVTADTGARPPPPQPAPAGAFAAAPAPAALARSRAAMEADVAPGAPPVAATPQAITDSSAGRVAFTLPAPATVRAGETANLPFLGIAVPAERVWWVQDLVARHPLSAVRIRNTTGHVLPDGLATVYGSAGAEAGAYLGDAEIRAVTPGEQRLLAFARDRDVQLSVAASTGEVPVRIDTRRGYVLVGTLRREETALAVDPRGARGPLLVDLPRRPGATPRFAVAAEGDFGLRHEAMLDGTPATLRFVWEREARNEIPLWDAGLGDPLLLQWRSIDLERERRRLPGGPGTLETLRTILERLPADAPGRDRLEAIIARLAEARRLLDAAATAIRAHLAADAALGRARAAAEDRTGPEREEARRRLNAASQAAERTGATADAAWEAWQRAVQQVMALTG